MRLLKFEVTNFGSYKHLEFDFTQAGLALVHGPTGSGKSTLSDAPLWILYGQTAKGGVADDVRSWQASNEPTTGIMGVSLPNGNITVTRIRAGGTKNDLYWTEEATPTKKERGKDITETQKKLSERLGCDYYLYAAGSHIGEFSNTGAFFTAKAADRRELLERLANLDFATELAEKTSLAKKSEKKLAETAEGELKFSQGRLSAATSNLRQVTEEAARWQGNQDKLLSDLASRGAVFAEEATVRHSKIIQERTQYERTRAEALRTLDSTIAQLESASVVPLSLLASIKDFQEQIASLGKEVCGACGSSKSSTQKEVLLNLLSDALRRKDKNLRDSVDLARALKDKEALLKTPGPYPGVQVDDQNPHLIRLGYEKNRENPFSKQGVKLQVDVKERQEEVALKEAQLLGHSERFTSLSTLHDMTAQLRGELLKQTVARIQDRTNRNLTAHFDAEIRVALTIQDADDLEVSIQKNGYDCNFKQLSKGQRCLLRLCFSVAVQEAAADRAGVHFANLYFDEALDGMDSELKTQAYGLLQELSTHHESVLVVEHFTEFQQRFEKKYRVELNGDYSDIYEE